MKQFTLTIWNSAIQPGGNIVHVPVTKNYTVRDPTGQIVETEVKFIEKFYFFYL